jgi:hypothetical protein
MKNNLKYLFAFLRSFKSDVIQTTILMDRNYIEEWDENFQTSNGKNVKLIKPIIEIIEELIEIYYDEIRGYLNFDYDEYWHLSVNIYPNEQKIQFTASCKEETASSFERDYEYTGLDEERQGNIDYLYSEFPDTAKIQFDAYGRWGDGQIYEFYVDGRQKKITSDYDDALWNIANYFMTKINGNWWNAEAGADFSITIWGDDIFVRGNTFTEEYQDTGMLIEVTLDNILNDSQQ